MNQTTDEQCDMPGGKRWKDEMKISCEISQTPTTSTPLPKRSKTELPEGDAEMFEIPTNENEGGEGQDVSMGLVGSLEPGRDDVIGQILL